MLLSDVFGVCILLLIIFLLFRWFNQPTKRMIDQMNEAQKWKSIYKGYSAGAADSRYG